MATDHVVSDKSAARGGYQHGFETDAACCYSATTARVRRGCPRRTRCAAVHLAFTNCRAAYNKASITPEDSDMAQFVHLAPDKYRDSIRRNGIKPRRLHSWIADDVAQGVFAMPVTDNFYVSHQWLRELKRRGQRTILGFYLRIPDGQPVLIGHYSQHHRHVTAAEAVGEVFDAEQTEGFEVVIPRKVAPHEIFRINALPQVVGWRYYPQAKGRKPCGCPFCTKGDIKSKKIRKAYEDSLI